MLAFCIAGYYSARMATSERNTPSSRFANYGRPAGVKAPHHINLRLPDDLYEELTKIGAAEGGLSMSDTIRVTLWRGIRAGTTVDPAVIQSAISSLQETLTNYTSNIVTDNKEIT